MTQATITLHLTDSTYRHLYRAAEITSRPIEEIVAQSISGNLPPLADGLSPQLQDEFAAMQKMNDKMLWRIASRPLSEADWNKHQKLLEQNQEVELEGHEKNQLLTLQENVDEFVMKRSLAFALLKWRGHTLPSMPTPI